MENQYDIYWVCFPLRDSVDSLHGDLAAARQRFFQKGRKPVRIYKDRAFSGFDGQIRGKLSAREFHWKKRIRTFGRPILEEAFRREGGWALVSRDFRGAIVSRVFFDRNHRWQRSEYYEPWDSSTARVIFRGREGLIQRWDWDPGKKSYRALSLYPSPYRSGTAEQSLVDARLGTPQLLLLTSEGELGFCSQKETQDRLRAMEEVSAGTMILMPAWEVKEGELVKDGDTGVTFPSLEDYARIPPPPQEEPALPPDAEAAGQLCEPVEDFTPGEEEGLPPLMQAALSEAGEAVRALLQDSGPEEPAKEEEALPPAPPPENGEALKPSGEAGGNGGNTQTNQDPSPAPPEKEEPAPQSPRQEAGESGESLEAILAKAAPAPLPLGPEQPASGGLMESQEKITGRGRAQQPGGATSYEGEYLDGKRHGFGSYYYKDGNLCYAGSWKEDRRDGLGVSFRDSDHALHVANWQEGQPQGLVTLFDSQGNLRYSGRMENGKKEGAGVIVNARDGTVFVGQWAGGEATGLGSAFDRDGRLLYYGGWKDGKRHGQGTEFDQNGSVIFDGEFREGKYYNGVLYQKLQNPAED